jgi:hypothetical protein
MRLARSIFGLPHMVIDVSYSGLALMTKTLMDLGRREEHS